MPTRELGYDAMFPFALGNQLACQLHYPSLRPEHLLLAMLKRPEGRLPTVARLLNLDFNLMQQQLEPLIPPSTGASFGGKLPSSPEVKRIRELAISEARRLCQSPTGAEHLFLALMLVPTEPASKVLAAHGLTAARLSVCLSQSFAPSNPDNVEGLGSQELEAWQRAKERHEQQLAEQRRKAELRQQVQNWKEAEDIRSFVKAVKTAASRGDISQGGLKAWLRWASEQADELDPIRKRFHQ